MWTTFLPRIHFFSLLKSHFCSRVMLANIENPDEISLLGCLGLGVMYACATPMLCLAQQVGSRTEEEAEAKLRRLWGLIIEVLLCCFLPWQYLVCLFPIPVRRPGCHCRLGLGVNRRAGKNSLFATLSKKVHLPWLCTDRWLDGHFLFKPLSFLMLTSFSLMHS